MPSRSKPGPAVSATAALAVLLVALMIMIMSCSTAPAHVNAIKIVVSTDHGSDSTCSLGTAGVSQVTPVRPDGVCKTLHRVGSRYDSMIVDCAAGTFRYYPDVPDCQGPTPTRVIGSCFDASPYGTISCRDADPSELMYGTVREGPGCTGAVDRDVVFQMGMCTTVGDAYAIHNISNGVFTQNRYSSYPCSGFPVNVTTGSIGTCYLNTKFNSSIVFQVGSPFPVPSPLTVKAVVQYYYGNNDATCTGARDYSRIVNAKPDGSCSKYPMSGGVSSIRVDCAAGTYSIYENTATCSGTPTTTTTLGSCANFHPYARLQCEDVDASTLIFGDVGSGLTCSNPDDVLIYQTGRCSSVGTALAVFSRGPASDSWSQTTYASYPCITPVNTTTGKFGVCYSAPAFNVSVTFRNATSALAAVSPPTSAGNRLGQALGLVAGVLVSCWILEI